MGRQRADSAPVIAAPVLSIPGSARARPPYRSRAPEIVDATLNRRQPSGRGCAKCRRANRAPGMNGGAPKAPSPIRATWSVSCNDTTQKRRLPSVPAGETARSLSRASNAPGAPLAVGLAHVRGKGPLLARGLTRHVLTGPSRILRTIHDADANIAAIFNRRDLLRVRPQQKLGEMQMPERLRAPALSN